MNSSIKRTFLWAGFLLSLAALPRSTWAVPQLVWQVGVDDDPYAAGYNATGEFSVENYINDPPPGRVTLPGNPPGNPGPDDDFYFAGTYPPGFNGLLSTLVVTNSEPNSAFERALTDGDRTNRIHFPLSAAQASNQSRLRLGFELV